MSGGNHGESGIKWADETGTQDEEQQGLQIPSIVGQPESPAELGSSANLINVPSGSLHDGSPEPSAPSLDEATNKYNHDPSSRTPLVGNGGQELIGVDDGHSALLGTPIWGSQDLTAAARSSERDSRASISSQRHPEPMIMSPATAYFSPLPSFEVGPLAVPTVDPETHCALVTSKVLMSQNPGGEFLDVPYVQESELADPAVPSSVFKFATAAYVTMCHSKRDQVIMNLGLQGAGKKESTKLIMEQIAFLSSERLRKNPSATKPEVNIGTAEDKPIQDALNTSNPYASTTLENDDVDAYYALFLKAHNLLEAFGCESTKVTPNSSRFGLYSELHFAEDGILLGAKFMEYAPAFSQNLHIFHFLLQGATDDEVEHFRLFDIPDSCPATAGRWNHPYFEGDDEAIAQVRGLLTELGISKQRTQHELFCLLAAILHIQNLPIAQDKSKKYGANSNAECVIPGNPELLEYIAEELLDGVDTAYLWGLISSRTVIIGGSYCTEYNSYEQALIARDQLVQCMYVHLFDWLVSAINRRLSKEANCVSTIGILSFPGLIEKVGMNLPIASPEVWTHHYATEEIFKRAFRSLKTEQSNDVSSGAAELDVPKVAEFMDEITRDIEWAHYEVLDGETKLAAALKNKYHQDEKFVNLSGGEIATVFGLKHSTSVEYAPTAYSAAQLLRKTTPYMPPAVAATLQKSYNRILADVFSLDAIQATNDPVRFTHLGARQRTETKAWKRTVSTVDRRKNRKFKVQKKSEEQRKQEQTSKIPPLPSNLNVYFTRINELLEGIKEHQIWGMVCTKTQTEVSDSVVIDEEYVEHQQRAFRLLDLVTDERAQLIQHRGFLSEVHEDDFRTQFMNPIQARNPQTYSQVGDGVKGFLEKFARTAGVDSNLEENRLAHFDHATHTVKLSNAGRYLLMVKAMDNDAEQGIRRRKTMRMTLSKPRGEAEVLEKKQDKPSEEKSKKEKPVYRTSQRKWWMYITTGLTFWVPDKCLRFGGKATADIRLAWREKFALNLLILILSAVLIFFIAFFSTLLCPPASLFTTAELATHNSILNKAFFMSWNGKVFDMTNFVHPNPTGYDQGNHYDVFGGQDVSHMFPRYDGPAGSFPAVCNAAQTGPIIAKRQDNNVTTFTPDPRCTTPDKPDVPGYCHVTGRVSNLIDGGVLAIREIGAVAWGFDVIVGKTTDDDAWVVIDDRVYFLSDILTYRPSVFSQDQISILSGNRGRDMTEFKESVADVIPCLDAIAYIGDVDIRSRFSCIFASYFLLATTAAMLFVVLVKFLAALQLGAKKQPEDIDKYVILQVPCYTEDEASLRKTINSLALTSYDDQRKLLFVVCDGMIRGSGNSLATPEIVLSIFGVPPEKYRDDPEPAYSYLAIGEGKKQHNRARIYAGFYSLQGRQIPYIVVVKCGTETELHRPGNRGKRDSQMVLMRFMNHVILNTPMTPMDLDLYEKIRQVSGVEPYDFEYTLMVDADTEVLPDSLTRLIAFCMGDRKIMGISGETGISNEKQSFVTMIQVFEYWISHHLNKAFESLFGTVTCLPGCFCMYRIRSSNKKQLEPILCHSDIIAEYSTCTVDTLHEKNLLHLGEDRYLTTLMLKHFPDKKNKFIPDAKCLTVVPDTFDVLLSQRRRWINSTIHNLFELLFVNQLCGCLIFSMRAIIALDLFATLVMPASVVYAGYIIYLAILGGLQDTITLVMLGMIYGLQMLLFIVKRQWQHFGWMIMHMISLPVFYCYIPLYSFWHFDDFSWGNTRVIAGETKVAKGHGPGGEDDKFDPSEIPLMTIKEYREKRRQKFLSGDIEKSSYQLGANQSMGIKQSHSMYPSTTLPMPVPVNQGNVKGSMSMYMNSPTLQAPQTPTWLKKSRSGRGLADEATGRSSQPSSPYPSAPNSPSAAAPTLQIQTTFDRGSAVSINVPHQNDRGERELTNEELMQFIREAISGQNPGMVSKQKVRQLIEERTGMSLHHRRGFISDAVEMIVHQSNSNV